MQITISLCLHCVSVSGRTQAHKKATKTCHTHELIIETDRLFDQSLVLER